MQFKKRKFVKILGFSALIMLFPIKALLAATKKIINPNLSKEQKNIMFNEGTERPFTSDLLKEKRKGFYHCANCGNKLFASTAKYDSGTGWPSFSEALPGAFKTKIDQATIFLTQAISGAQVSDQERERIRELIPQVGDTER